MKYSIRILMGLALGALSAGLMIFSFQPYSIWPLVLIAHVPMQVAAHRVLPLRWSGLAPGVGVGVFLAIFLSSLFGTNEALWVFLLVAGMIALVGVLSTPKVRAFHFRTGYRWFILQGAIEAAGIEFVRSFIRPLDTHAFFAQTVYSQPWLLQPISIFGTYGLSALLVLFNFSLTLLVIRWFDRNWQWDEIPVMDVPSVNRWLAGTLAVCLVWIGIGAVILAVAPDNVETVRVAAVQHGFTVPGHQDPKNQEKRLAALGEQTRVAAEQGAQLVVWPELGLGFDPQVEHTSELQTLAIETDTYILIGYGLDDPAGWRNEVVLLSPEGMFLDVYGKNHPSVPSEPPIISSGAYPVYETSFGPMGTIICNDVNFPGTTRALVQKGAQLITVPTYESGAPGLGWEQRPQSVLRAVQHRVAIIKADNAGISMVIDPYGRIIAQVNKAAGEAYALVADVSLGSGNTLYNQLGDWVGWVALAGTVIFSVMTGKKQKMER